MLGPTPAMPCGCRLSSISPPLPFCASVSYSKPQLLLFQVDQQSKQQHQGVHIPLSFSPPKGHSRRCTFQALGLFFICTLCEGDLRVFCFSLCIKWNELRLMNRHLISGKKIWSFRVTDTWDPNNTEFAKQMAICWRKVMNLKNKTPRLSQLCQETLN